jgi:hypothetical protein
MKNERNPKQKKEHPGNRFAVATGRLPYTDKSEYLQALGDQLTPDIWDAIIGRAIHDAALGSRIERVKAREWLAKYVLPIKAEIELRKVPRMDHDWFSQIYEVFRHGAKTPADVERAIAITLGDLTPEERATMRAALQVADSDEMRMFWDDLRATSETIMDDDG